MSEKNKKPDTNQSAIDPVILNQMRFQSDAWADAAIAAVLGHWDNTPPNAVDDSRINLATSAETASATWMPDWAKLNAMTAAFTKWESNQTLVDWRGDTSLLPSDVSTAIANYVTAAKTMPEWADADKIARAERVFMDYGPLSVLMLFCSSLPECYVVPDLSAVLHTTGQLEKHTEYRVRSTGAMIFPVMMRGGLTTPDGGGLAQVFKVRLIHATIRHLILRRSPEDMLAAIATWSQANESHNPEDTRRPGYVPPLAMIQSTDGMFQTLFARGWDVEKLGIPCNQEELLYTLMTFSYVFLRSMRRLNIGLTPDDENAYIHVWNVAGHFLGIDHDLMPETYDEAGKLFDAIQAAGRLRQQQVVPDVRPNLGIALMNAMKSVIPTETLKQFPTLMTQKLCGAESSRDLGLDKPIGWWPRTVFTVVVGGATTIDKIVRIVIPKFSLVRFITRLLGYRFISKLLMAQTRDLKLPTHVQKRIGDMMGQWGKDR
jgi:ER-bound oxygenase mpaB/B'/Rubber oxygenase, catalytic domain